MSVRVNGQFNNMFTPSKPEFLELAKQGNLIPVYREIIADAETPVSAYQKLQKSGGSFLLESVVGGEHIGRYSFVGSHPRKVIRVDRVHGGDPLQLVEREMAQFRPASIPGLPQFTGGAVGFLGYEYIHQVEASVPEPARDDLHTPVLCFMITDTIVIFDRVSQTIKIVANAHLDSKPEVAYAAACARVDEIIHELQQPLAARALEFRKDVPEAPVESNITSERHAGMVAKAKEYICAGDIIQVVLAQRFQTRTRSSALDIYRALRSINPSPYMFLLDFGGFQLVGASPEVHVRCEAGKVEIRPIAGTRWRGKTPEEDARLEKDLLADEKERAEHLMLVDLARNDIGRVCDFGSVRVPEFMAIEKYSHVMHIVSGVEGNLQKGRTAYDLMRATFPAGTVSGAPKIRAMQIISELEQVQRGPYAGAVGYFGFTGNVNSCITLRTALVKDGIAYVQAGGGIVADSDPQYEFNETVNKAKAMIKAIALAETFHGAAH
ncbi:MAG TPA: anthranilate synthase component I [Verrucomicrobiae bacterium]|nr:anthranilate synthase component I [Verrucomicrobiae bacterium]